MTNPSFTRRGGAAAVAVAVVVSAIHPPIAGAIVPDNTGHDVNGSSLTTWGEDARQWAQYWFMGQDGSARLAPFNIANNGTGDVHFKDGFYGAGNYGKTSCTSWIWWNPYRCDHMDVKLNQTTLSTTNFGQWKSTACHELGHSINLDHNQNSCMADGNVFPIRYDSSDANWANIIGCCL
jgi:hypothetical protein